MKGIIAALMAFVLWMSLGGAPTDALFILGAETVFYWAVKEISRGMGK